MKALQTIGIVCALRFAAGQVAGAMLAVCVIPQLRVSLLRLLGARIGRNCIVHSCRFFNFYRGTFRNLIMGDDCFIGEDCLIDLAARIELGSGVTIAERVNVITHLNVGYPDHPLQRYFPARAEGVRLGNGVFVGVCATVLCGVDIGEKTFVAAGAVVSRALPSQVLAGGVPARVLRHLEGADVCTDGTAKTPQCGGLSDG